MNRRAFLAGGAAALTVAAVARAQGLRGALPATEFGIDPASGADQTAALQQAFSDAAAMGMPLFLPPGHYPVERLYLPNRLQLYGVPGETVLVAAGDRGIFFAEFADRIALDGLVLDGQEHPLEIGGLLAILTVADIDLRRLSVTGAGGTALLVDGCGGRVADCYIAGAADVGIYAVQSTGLSITDNRVTGAGNTGILIQRWEKGTDGTIVTGNRVAGTRTLGGGNGQNGNGINLVNAGGVLVSNNHIADSAFSAIRAFQSDDALIGGNQCHGSIEVGIFCEFAFEGAVVAGNVVDGAAGGISIANADVGGRLATVSGNVVRHIVADAPQDEPGFGFGIAAEADTAITGNAIDDCAGAGLSLGWGPYLRNVAATGNVINDVRIGIAVSVVEGAGAAVIADNLIGGPREGAIRGMEWLEIATPDLAETGADAWPHLTLSGNRAV